jgi:hypothetical protein
MQIFFFTVPILIPDLAKHFLHAAVLVLVPNKMLRCGRCHKRLTVSPGVLPSKLDTLATQVYTKKANTEKPYPSIDLIHDNLL